MARGNRIALLMSSLGKTQVDKNTPLDLADLDLRINVTSRNWVDTVKTIEEILDCVGEEVVSKELTKIIRRLSIEGEFNTAFCSPLAALTFGASAAPTGGVPSNKILTLEIQNATGGFFKLSLDYDGINQTSANIPYNCSIGQLKKAIEDLDNIGYGNTSVTKVGNVFTIEFVGKRSFAPVSDFTFTSTLTGVGATVVIAQTQAGVQKSHNITEMSDYALPMTTFGIAFEDEAGSERLLVGATVENLVFNLPESNGKVTFTCDIIARDLILEPGLNIPGCVSYRATRTSDCNLVRGATDLTDLLRQANFSYNNNTLIGNSAYTGRGVKPSRLERATRRNRSLSYTLLGAAETLNNTVYQEAEINPEADVKQLTSLRVGVEGDCIIINIPNALTELATGGGGIAFDNESEEGLLRLVDTPTKIGGVSPTNLIAKFNQAGTLLTPA